MKLRLTKRSIEALEAKIAAYDVQDESLPGFAIRVRPSGAKSYILRYRPKGSGRQGAVRTLTIGRYPQVTPEIAREIAQRHLGRIASGGDPARERSRPESKTVADILQAYLSSLEGRPSHRVVKYDVALHLLPALGGKRLGELRAGDVEALRDRLIVEGKRRRAGAVVTTLRAALRRAKVDASAAQVKAPGHRKRRRAASLDELKAVLLACRELLQEGEIWPWSIHLAILVMMTGARPSEIRTARWSDVDWGRGRLVRYEHKMAHRTGDAREIELPPPAVQQLRNMPRIPGNPHIIAGKKRGRCLEHYAPAWAAICKRAKVEGLWLYDARRTFASIGLGLGFTLPQLARALGHDDMAAIDSYAWLIASDRTSLSSQVAGVVARLSSHPDTPAGPTGDREPSPPA